MNSYYGLCTVLDSDVTTVIAMGSAPFGVYSLLRETDNESVNIYVRKFQGVIGTRKNQQQTTREWEGE